MFETIRHQYPQPQVAAFLDANGVNPDDVPLANPIRTFGPVGLVTAYPNRDADRTRPRLFLIRHGIGSRFVAVLAPAWARNIARARARHEGGA